LDTVIQQSLYSGEAKNAKKYEEKYVPIGAKSLNTLQGFK
jgi:hypothetical protein